MRIFRNRLTEPPCGAPERLERTTAPVTPGRARGACHGTTTKRTEPAMQPFSPSMQARDARPTRGEHMQLRLRDAYDTNGHGRQLRPLNAAVQRPEQCSHGTRATRQGREWCCRHVVPAREILSTCQAHPSQRHALRRVRALRRPCPITAPSLGASQR